MRRLAVIACALAVAVTTAVLALPTFAFAAALLHGSLSGLPGSVLDIVVWWAVADGSGQILHQAVTAAAKAMAVICCGPVILAALIGEVAGLRGATWFVAATAGLSVVLPFAAGAGALGALAQPMALGPLVATGAVTGLVYWLIAAPPARPSPLRARADGLNLADTPTSATEKTEKTNS